MAGRIAVLVHVGGCPIEDAIELTKHAEAAGADVISTSVPGAYDHLKGEFVRIRRVGVFLLLYSSSSCSYKLK